MTSQEQRIAALEDEIVTLRDATASLTVMLIEAGKYAGVDLTPPSTPEPEGAVIFALADYRRDTKNCVAGRTAGRVTAFAAPRHAATPGMAAS